jgi:long-chain acyl-CoA synthetase
MMFSYTSGTTGDPKGVKLTQKMLLMAATAVMLRMRRNNLGLTEADRYISYLPLAHSFEQALFAMSTIFGIQCGFFGGDVLKLTKEDIPVLKPTFFPSVPRLYNRIYGVIQDKLKEATGFKGWLVGNAIATKTAALNTTGAVTHGCYDSIVFNKMKAIMGGQVRIMLTGSAPISKEVLDFLKICFCCPILEGYGMTETSAGSCITIPGDPKSGHVGGPVCNVKIRLRDIPEMNYLSTNNPPKGEICFWGPSIMKGYFKNEEKTAEALPDGEWLRSGDVGVVHPNGSIQIVDRAKNIFKLSQGEYIAPEKLENVYVQSEFILQAWIHGDSLHDFICLFAVLDPVKLEAWCKDHNKEKNAALRDDALIAMINKDLMRLAGENKLNSLEKPKQYTLLVDPFTIENDLLTPTMKLKRNVAV